MLLWAQAFSHISLFLTKSDEQETNDVEIADDKETNDVEIADDIDPPSEEDLSTTDNTTDNTTDIIASGDLPIKMPITVAITVASFGQNEIIEVDNHKGDSLITGRRLLASTGVIADSTLSGFQDHPINTAFPSLEFNVNLAAVFKNLLTTPSEMDAKLFDVTIQVSTRHKARY